MYCVKCGKLIDDKSKFCVHCGAAINNTVADLQDQIDGSVTTWFGTGEPTLNNYPVVGDPEGDWVTDEVKDRHIGDVYYDDNTGKAYRFQINKATGIYEWETYCQ